MEMHGHLLGDRDGETGRPLYGRRGTSGFVQLAENMETGEIVAIKFLERGGSASQRVIARELLNHRECALHPNIVQLKVSSCAAGGLLGICWLQTGHPLLCRTATRVASLFTCS